MATYLNRTPSGASNRKTWTYSTWVKRSKLGAGSCFFQCGAGTVEFGAYFMANDTLEVYEYDSGSFRFQYKTDQVFRDPSAWYHIVIACDTTQGSAGDRVKIYLNGSQITSFSTATNPSQDFDTQVNLNTPHKIGVAQYGSGFYLGYIAQTILVDGTALTPSTFGSTNANGIWVPNTGPSVTYGTNGFKLDFAGTGTTADASGFGADSSGNGNHFTANSLGTNPSTTDTTQNNFSTFNPLIERPGEGFATFTEGNLKASGTSKMAFSSIALPSSGKWYAEFKANAGSSTASVGLRDIDDYTADGNSNRLYYRNDGQKDTGSGASSYGSSWTTGDVLSIACNVDSSQVTFYKNGTAQDSGTAISQNCQNQYIMVSTAGGWSFQANFGNPTFTIASGNADANGYGNFEYAVPSGYYALCTKNLALYGG